jgi:hypothetical protein
VKVTSRDGRTWEKLILNRRGSPEDPLKPEDIEYKYRHVLGSCVPQDRSARILTLVKGLEKASSARELIELVAAPTI